MQLVRIIETMANEEAPDLKGQIKQLQLQVDYLQQQLHQTQNQFDAFMENSPATAFFKDQDGRLLYINRAFADAFNFHNRDWRGKSDFELWPAEEAAVLRCNDEAILRDWEPQAVEETVTQDDGEHHWLTFKFPFRDGKGNSYLGGMGIDLTEQKNTEQALRAAKEQADAAQRLMHEFVSCVSHEIRTPMNGILGATDLLQDLVQGGETQEYVDMIDRSATALLSLINDILDVTRLDANKVEIQHSRFGLQALLGDLQQIYWPEASKKNLQLHINVADGIPEKFYGDPGRLRQILVNLLGNAIKFTEQGEVRLRVDGFLEDDQWLMRFVVSDTGIGIAPHLQEKIFDKFVQGDSTMSRRYDGVGLGLSISRQLAGLMGGSIGVDSEPGMGACFTLTMPLSQDVYHESQKMPARDDLQFDACVLLAEDNPANQKIGRAILQKLGLSVDVAANGVEALALAEQKDYTLILMDMQMPDMDGLEASRRIRGLAGNRATVPIIAMTANVSDEARQSCLAAGMNDYISKPISIKQLRDLLLKWIPDVLVRPDSDKSQT